MGKLLEKENEQQVEKPQLTDEEKKVLDEARSIRRKARGNNGAKRDVHEECEVEYKDVYPSRNGGLVVTGGMGIKKRNRD